MVLSDVQGLALRKQRLVPVEKMGRGGCRNGITPKRGSVPTAGEIVHPGTMLSFGMGKRRVLIFS